MLNIYTNKNLLTRPLIFSIDSKFHEIFRDYGLNEKDVMYIQTIDGAHIIDINLGTIQTHFGVTSVENLSAGTKTLIVANHLNNSEIAIRLDNCGKNVLEVFFKDFIQSKIECFITHLVSIDMCEKLENFNLYFNNQIIELKDFNKNLKIEVERVYNDLI